MDNIKLEKLINEFRELKDERDSLNAAKTENTKAIEKLQRQIIEEMQGQGIESAGTDKMSVSIKIEAAYNIKNKQAFLNWVYENGQIGAIILRANNRVINELVEEKNILPDGAEVYTNEKLNARRKN